MKGHRSIGLRLCVKVAAVIVAWAAIASHLPVHAVSPPMPRALPGFVDAVYADPANLMYSYGPSEAERWSLQAANAFTSNITVTYDAGFVANPQARAAFQAAVDVWRSVIASPAPIRVSASLRNLGNPTVLGSAGPTAICSATAGVANTFYAAALADELSGSPFCATLAGVTTEITASFNSTFTNWDFGTSGTPVSGKYSFLTVVLHEVGHGLGFYGSMTASGGIGRFGYGPSFPNYVDIYDRFAVTGAGAALKGFVNPSAALGLQLVSNNTFFNGSIATSNNGGLNPKLETHNFTTAYGVTSDNGFKPGSSYSHVDDVLYSGTPNGLMTWALAQAEVYTDPGPIMRGMFSDVGWTTTSNCSYSLSSTSSNAVAKPSTGGVNVVAGTGCAWTATSNASWLTVTSGSIGSGNGTVDYAVAANSGGVRSGTLTIAGQPFTVTQAAASPSEFDGDGTTDVAVYRPSNGTWSLLTSSTGFVGGAGYSWGASTDVPVPGDYDGDGRTDVAVYRPSTGQWLILTSSSLYAASLTVPWGVRTDIPVPADYDGDGKTDPAVYRPSTGDWRILQSSTGYATFVSVLWGNSTDIPVPADYDGDGKTDLAVFRRSTETWLIKKSSTGYTTTLTVPWGINSDIPVPGDYDGDGKADPAVYRPSNGGWFVLQSSTAYSTSLNAVGWGVPTDTPVPADYDGDGRFDLAVYRPSAGGWYIRTSSTGYAATITVLLGASTDIPLPNSGVVSAIAGVSTDLRRGGDFDGDRKADFTVYRPSNGAWYVLPSTSGYAYANGFGVLWGASADRPVPGDYDGDGQTDFGVYRPSMGQWLVLTSSSGYLYASSISVLWGVSTDLPVPGDYDGDGKTDIAVYRPSTGQWLILTSSTGYGSSFGLIWGDPTDVPVPGDYDGDGKTDPAVYRPSTGQWLIRLSTSNYVSTLNVPWGVSTDVAVPGDYDRDGRTDVAVYRPSTGQWLILTSGTGYAYASALGLYWGNSTDVPVPGDFDGDGQTDVAVYRPSAGGWYVRLSSSGYATAINVNSWGESTDLPILRRQ